MFSNPEHFWIQWFWFQNWCSKIRKHSFFFRFLFFSHVICHDIILNTCSLPAPDYLHDSVRPSQVYVRREVDSAESVKSWLMPLAMYFKFISVMSYGSWKTIFIIFVCRRYHFWNMNSTASWWMTCKAEIQNIMQFSTWNPSWLSKKVLYSLLSRVSYSPIKALLVFSCTIMMGISRNLPFKLLKLLVQSLVLFFVYMLNDLIIFEYDCKLFPPWFHSMKPLFKKKKLNVSTNFSFRKPMVSLHRIP